MAAAKPIVQDRAPPGGFAPVKFERSLPARGPSGATLFVLGAVAIIGGMCVAGRHAGGWGWCTR
jgi:hypothetical protein